jgi:hypothetical protein
MTDKTLGLLFLLGTMVATVLIIVLPTIIRDYRRRHQK